MDGASVFGGNRWRRRGHTSRARIDVGSAALLSRGKLLAPVQSEMRSDFRSDSWGLRCVGLRVKMGDYATVRVGYPEIRGSVAVFGWVSWRRVRWWRREVLRCDRFLGNDRECVCKLWYTDCFSLLKFDMRIFVLELGERREQSLNFVRVYVVRIQWSAKRLFVLLRVCSFH